jgi:hypothetical protein
MQRITKTNSTRLIPSANSLNNLGALVSDHVLILNVLRGLNKQYKHLSAIFTHTTPFPSFQKVRDDLCLEEIQQGVQGTQSAAAAPTAFYAASKPSAPPPAPGGQARPPGQQQQQQFQPPQQQQQQSGKKNNNYRGHGRPYGGNSGSNGGNSSSNGSNSSCSSKNQGGEASWPSYAIV